MTSIRSIRFAAAALVAAWCLCSSALAAEQHFRIDLDQSEITAAVAEPMSSIRGDAVGKFRLLSCDVYQDPRRRPDDGANIWVEAVVDAASYSSGSSARDNSVKNSILDVKDYPTISFKGGSSWTDVKQTSETAGSATLKGQLMMHGAVRPFEVPVHVSLSGNRLVCDGEVSFNYTDFGITQPSILGFKAGNMVKVTYHIVAVRAPQGL